MFQCLIRTESLTVLVSALRFFNHLVPHVSTRIPFGKQVSFGLLTGTQPVRVSNLHTNQYTTVQLSTYAKAMSYNDGMRKLDKVKRSNNATYRCHYYVVWCPKYRRKVITSLNPKLANPPIEGDPGPVDERLKQIIREVCKETGSEIVKLEVMPDQVHLIVDCAPQYGIHKLVRLIKARTSRYLRAEFSSVKRRLPSLWTNNYFVATVGREPLEIVEQYVQNQRNV